MLKKLQCFCVLGFGITTMAGAVTFTDQANIPSWGTTAVDQLVTANVISGNDDGSLAPWRSINRAEFLKILTSATGVTVVNSSGTDFPDVPNEAWFGPYVHTAVQNGWAKGYPDGTFKPGNLINRAEIAKLISEAWSLPLTIKAEDTNWFDIYVRALTEADRLPYAAAQNQFDPGKNPSRIEVFEQLHRTWAAHQTAINDELIIPAIEEKENPENITDPTTNEEDLVIPESSELESSENESDQPEESEQEQDEEEEATPSPTTSNPTPELPPTPPVDESALGLTNSSTSQTQPIYPGQGGITAFSATLEPLKEAPVVESITFSHEGDAPVSNFSRMWITDDSERISQAIVPEGTQNQVKFEPALQVDMPIEIFLKLDTPSAAEDGYTSRWRIESINDIETTTDLSQIVFPIDGQWMEIFPE